MNGVFNFDDKGVISSLDLSFTDETEKNAWCAMLKLIGGPVPESKMRIWTKPFSTGVEISIREEKKSV